MTDLLNQNIEIKPQPTQLCVLQTTTGDEWKVEKHMNVIVDQGMIIEQFMPKREVCKKWHGKWQKLEEKMFPGYLFLATNDSEKLFFELKKVPYLTKLLGDVEAKFITLNNKEQHFIERIGASRGDHTLRTSQVQIESDAPYKKGDHVKILSGDLAAFEGEIVGYDFHHRKAMIQTDLFGGQVIHVGIELVGKA